MNQRDTEFTIHALRTARTKYLECAAIAELTHPQLQRDFEWQAKEAERIASELENTV